MPEMVIFLLCLSSALAQWPQQQQPITYNQAMSWNNANYGFAAQSNQNPWSVAPQASTSAPSQAYVTGSPSSSTTQTLSTEPPLIFDEKPKIEAEEISALKNAPGSEMKDALPGSAYENRLVDEINNYRLMHGSGQLRVNADLSKKARAWAQKMASDDRESLDVNSNYGQLTFSAPSDITPNIAVAAARHWYNRVKNYAWDKPDISTKSMQFTQLVWAASQQLGVGVAQDQSGSKFYVTALFSPRGNIKNQIIQNVLPVTGSGAGKRGADSCPKGWHKFKKSCFRYFNNNVKWAEAANLCDDEHSSLASLESAEEESSVRNMLAKDEGSEAWIGLSDRVHPDTKDLIWVDGNPMPYSNWNQYQDDQIQGRKCATLSTGTQGWMYKACQETFGFVCKKRLKDIMTYLIVLSYPEKLWSENLKNEVSPRYMAMKKHLDHAIMNLYNDDDWFVDMLFESFSPSPDDKVTAEFKLRFSPDGDAPSDPLEKLRMKLDSTGLVEGEKILLAHVSLQNDDPDSCPSNCLNTRSSCSSPDCPVYCCRTFPTKRKSAKPPRRRIFSFFAKNTVLQPSRNFAPNFFLPNVRKDYFGARTNYFQSYGSSMFEKGNIWPTQRKFTMAQQPFVQNRQESLQGQPLMRGLQQFSPNAVDNNQQQQLLLQQQQRQPLRNQDQNAYNEKFYSFNFVPSSAYIPRSSYSYSQLYQRNTGHKKIRHLKKCPGHCPNVCAPSCIHGCCRMKRADYGNIL